MDKLLFLKSRMTSKSKYRATLVSSEAGHARFWSLPGETESLGNLIIKLQVIIIQPLHPLGSFCLSGSINGEARNVLDLCTDPEDQFLIAGDIQGYITIFDIKNYCNGSAAKALCYYNYDSMPLKIIINFAFRM